MESFDDKQPYDEYYVDFDFVNVIVSSQTISSAVVSVTDNTGTDVTSSLTDSTKQTITSPKVYVWVRQGTTTITYTITCKIVTSGGEKYEMEGTLKVLET